MKTAIADAIYGEVNQYAFQWLKEAHETYMRKDYGAVYEKFIKN